MLSARTALFRQIKTAFETEFLGMLSFEDAVVHLAEKPMTREDVKDRRQDGLSDEFEVVKVDIDAFRIVVASPEDYPPLGIVKLIGRNDGNVMHEGPLDNSTWREIGRMVRQAVQQKEPINGY